MPRPAERQDVGTPSSHNVAAEMVRVLLIPLVVIVAGLLSRRWPNTVLRLATFALSALIAGSTIVVVTGIAWSGVGSAHAAVSHWFVALAWLPFWAFAGMVFEHAITSGRWRRLSLILLSPAAAGASLLAGFTGYLGPSRATDPLTLIRFKVFHLAVFPSALLILLGAMLYVSRRWRRAAQHTG